MRRTDKADRMLRDGIVALKGGVAGQRRGRDKVFQSIKLRSPLLLAKLIVEVVVVRFVLYANDVTTIES